MKKPFLYNTFLLLTALGMAAIPTKVLAHQVQTNYFLNSSQSPSQSLDQSLSQTEAQAADRLELRTTFSNGEPLKGAKVQVYAPEQPFRVWETGVTDSQGRYTFVPDPAIGGEWEVRIERAGHKDILRVPVSTEGIDADLIAQGEGNQDVHYASSPWMAVGSVAIAAACLGVAQVSRKRRAGKSL
ncbi:MAG: carboxypeptidase regulatory-like domain-containing protein [Phormidesmis sp. RL_2_1]|nr:carboxypeptidase regulatory-like domain-containing protein [Phormidesmis sp. RL_2_1]